MHLYDSSIIPIALNNQGFLIAQVKDNDEISKYQKRLISISDMSK